MNLMIIDGNSIVNRAFYGVRALNAPDGTPTNAVYGFLAVFRRLYEEVKPDAVCVSFDLKEPTFRHKAYDGYKAQRKPMPDDLAVQMPILKAVLDAMGIRRYELPGYEADDILGTASRICEERGWTCCVVTGDKDSFQLISDKTTVCNVKTHMGKTETVMYTPARFEEEYGFAPNGIIDLKALMGDTSDNIPGVSGIGEKTALDLVRRYGSVENIYAKLDELEIKEGARKKLALGEESAKMSYWLATIMRDVPLEFDPGDSLWKNDYTKELYGVFKRLGFNKFIEKWGLTESGAAAEAESGEALSSFEHIELETPQEAFALAEKLTAGTLVAIAPTYGFDVLELCDGEKVYRAAWTLCLDGFTALIKAVFSPEVKKVACNVKELMRLALDEGFSAEGFVFDISLAAYLLAATDSDYSLERVSMRYLERECVGTEGIWRLYPVLEKRLTEYGLNELYYSAELPLCRVLADMERAGFCVDRAALYEYGESLNADIEDLQQRIWFYAGEEFNINSPKQLGTVLFEKLMLPYGKKTKTGWSTGADILEKLRGKHPIVDDVLDYRTLTKLKSTYADGLLKVISADGRIHTSFQMTVTATGRLSSTEPNLQNIPVRSNLGAKIREMFVAAPGMCLVDADYSQIELRILAHISGDETMKAAFVSGEDFHTVTAANVFNVPVNEVTPTLRSRAKAVNFGIVYGISAFSLAQDIGVSQSEAKEYMEAYLEKYHGVRDYMHSVVAKAREDGYVVTAFGRRRDMPELKSPKFMLRAFGERVALNMPIQGTAADVIKLAMVSVHKRLAEEGLKARLILQVHDELIVECPQNEAERVREILTQEMENAAAFSVPLTVDAHIGQSWAEAH